jgi:hypothetical protein
MREIYAFEYEETATGSYLDIDHDSKLFFFNIPGNITFHSKKIVHFISKNAANSTVYHALSSVSLYGYTALWTLAAFSVS